MIRPTSATSAGPSSCGRASRGGSAMADDRVLLTVLLHHDQSKPLDEIMAHAKKTGFYRDFPPEGAEIVSWVVAMSYGFIIQLRVAPGALRSVNRYMEQKAWGAFRYQVFPSYDFVPIAAQLKKDHA
ncbi:MAG: hypothetical protein AUG14_08560 [Candidatus Rokubacteria bacterium 13_1_20CM_2_68_19]|nr:MAG: hypothetical protein AUH76_12875 [Candidatus Rokubacteria bacterium 13_1_40CM_4_67_11]OLD32635.1 MAG: hypothetical protein AUI49_02510 [Candidatus Rokubacteria bacterium 13_1_40CM_2_68_13]OLE43460.1 MAG: hypothetical protein AUG14_08560 [Candidatus Rokubacteria bacterium 13_1_20CM_2_68_19]